MTTRLDLRGQYGVVRTRGFVAWVIRLATRSPVNHAFVYISNDQIVEAEPQGAKVSHPSKYGDDAIVSHFSLTFEQQAAVAVQGMKAAGTPYNFLDIASLALLSLGLRWNWLCQRAQSSKTLICSQLVDRVYADADVHLYDDGRPDGEVTPGDLLFLLAERSIGTRL